MTRSEWIKKIASRPWMWFGVLPAIIFVAYWSFFISLSPSLNWRIPTLPKVFFDEPMYMQVLAKDLFHGFHIIPLVARPALWIGEILVPVVSLSELYALGVIASIIVSVWLLSFLIARVTGGSKEHARFQAGLLFLVGGVILAFRPGGPSWYVPFFLLGLIGLVNAVQAVHAKRWLEAILWSVAAVVISSAYPWYFATVIAAFGILFLFYFYRPIHVWILLGGGAIVTAIALWQQSAIVNTLSHSYAVLLALYGGIMMSHLTVFSNTLIAIAFWIVLWMYAARKHPSERAWVPQFMLALWVGQMILWLQPTITGLSIVPDHFIYSVWILSALSCVAWPSIVQEKHPLLWIRVIGILSAFYVVYVHVKLVLGVYSWLDYPSLVIHIVIWLFIAAAVAWSMNRAVAVWGLGVCAVLMIVLSFAGIFVKAQGQHADMSELEGVRTWIASQRLETSLNWCSDINASEYLFASTGATFHPSYSERHDPVWYPVFQNRRIEQSAFFNPEAAGELYMWDDSFVHGLAINCMVAAPEKRLVESLPISQEAKNFFTGCDDAWMSSIIADTEARMRERWEAPVPQSSALCDRFVVRRRLWDNWHVPVSYELLFKDEFAAVYAK